MAQAGFTPILIYASGTATNVPAAGNLTSSASGAELAINYADGKLYYKDSGGSVQLIASKSGASGDVVGPASATDNAIVRFDGTTGKLVQNSVVTIADSTGDISGVGQLNATTLDATNIEVTNIKAKDGTAAASIADSTGKITVSTELAVDNLNLSGNTLSSTDTNGNIVLAPNGTGDVQLDADTVRIGDSNANATLTTNGTGDLILNTNSGTNSGSITIADGANGDMTLTPNGNGSVVITNNGTSNALRITQTGAGNALAVEDSANPDATPFTIDSNGTVYAGVTVGYTSSGITTPVVNVGVTTAGAGIGVSSWAGATSGAGNFQFMKSRGASPGTYTVVADGDSLGIIRFSGSDGTNFISAATIVSAVDGTPGTNDMPGRLTFNTTADGASSPTERMRIDSAGNVGIGTTASSGITLQVQKTLTGSVNSYNIYSAPTNASDVTNIEAAYLSIPSTGFAVSNVYGYWAAQGTFTGAVTNQMGFHAHSNLTGATNNFGFYSNIASGTGRWNFYANGTADNYFAGSVGIGAAPESDSKVIVGGTLPSNASSSKAYAASFFVPSSSTSSAYGFLTYANTSATAFTLSSLYHYEAIQGTVGAGSAITNQFGFRVSSSLTGATNNYGFYSDIASGTNRWNFYANGTASNYFAGDMQLDKTVTATGTTGAQTINKNAGTVNFAAAATSLVVTDSRVTANSIIICTVGTNDTTMKSVAAVAGAGSFTLHANAAATAETRVNFLIIN